MYRVDKKDFVVVVRLSFEVILRVEVINVIVLSSRIQCKYTFLMKCMLFIVSHSLSLLVIVVAHFAIVVLDDLLISLNCSWLSSWNSSCFKARLFTIVLFVILNWRLELTLWVEISLQWKLSTWSKKARAKELKRAIAKSTCYYLELASRVDVLSWNVIVVRHHWFDQRKLERKN